MWERIVGALSVLDRLVDDQPRAMLSRRIASLVAPSRVALGDDVRPEDDDRTRSLRGLLLNTAAVLASEAAAQDRCRALLDRFIADPASVEPSLSAPALTVHGLDVTVADLVLVPERGVLYAGTHGQGVWMLRAH